MDANFIFTEEEDDLLINLVSQQSLLYNTNEEDYKNQLKKEKVWIEIAAILHRSGDSCKKRWKNIKDTYYRQKRKYNKSGTGLEMPQHPRSKFKKYSDLLSFLEGAPRERLAEGIIETDGSTVQDTQPSDQHNELVFIKQEENSQEQPEMLTEKSRFFTTSLETDLNIIFTEEEDDLLINLVSQQTILYDTSEEDYKNQFKKDKVWSDIATLLNRSTESCKKRWRNIKDTYFRQKRKHIKSGTGLEMPQHPRSKYKKYSDLLSFLEAVPRERLADGNTETDESTIQDTQKTDQHNDGCLVFIKQEENSQEQSEVLTEKSLANTTTLKDTSSSKSQRSAINLLKSRKKQNKNYIINYLKKREQSRRRLLENVLKHSDDDEVTSFSEHLKSVLKKLPPVLKIKARKELYDVLTKYEFLSLDSQFFSTQTFSSDASIHSTGHILPEQGKYSPV